MKIINIKLLENEEFRDVEGYEGLYSVSNMGRVYSWKSNKLLKGFNKSGYLYVKLFMSNKITKNKSIHSLVLKNFTNKSEWKDVPNHLDFNPHNNKLDNLQWSTYSENLLHFYKNRKRNKFLKKVKIKEIRNLYVNNKLSELEIANLYSFNRSTIHNIVQNNTYYDEDYTPPNRKFKNGYSDEFISIIKDMYYVYNLPMFKIYNMFNLPKSYVHDAIQKYHKHLD